MIHFICDACVVFAFQAGTAENVSLLELRTELEPIILNLVLIWIAIFLKRLEIFLANFKTES